MIRLYFAPELEAKKTNICDAIKEIGESYELTIQKGDEFLLDKQNLRLSIHSLKALSTDGLDEIGYELKNANSKIIFIIDGNKCPENLKPQLSSWIESYATKILFLLDDFDSVFLKANLSNFLLKNKSEEISDSVAKLVQRSLKELQRVKKLHEKIVPLRSESIKGLNIFSKFGAGSESGGEFFDVIKRDKECLILLSSSNSYVCSSILLAHFEAFGGFESFSIEQIESFLTDLYADIKNKGLVESESDLNIFLARIDLNKMSLEGHLFGNFDIVSSLGEKSGANELAFNPMFFEKSYFEMRLERSGKFLILSPGTIMNLKEFLSATQVEHLRDEVIKKPCKEAVNEIFYQMDKSKPTTFLKYDATVLSLEVDANVIIQV